MNKYEQAEWRFRHGRNRNSPHGVWNSTIDHCTNLASSMLARKIQPVLKTGAKEHSNKLLTNLDTVSSCIAPQELLIFSDLKDHKGSYTIHDALDKLAASTAKINPDFEVYHLQRGLQHTGKGLSDLDGGWTLDKYKFLPMIQKSWQLKPEKDWYIFFETDTYVFWKSMIEFLSHFDPGKVWYIGSPVWPADGSVIFAHGGSGFVLSKAAMRKLNSEIPAGLMGGYEFGEKVSQWCCGDQVLAAVLNHKGIRLKGYWPMFNGEKSSSLFFDDESWCQPVLTFHHLSSNELSELWTEERSWMTDHYRPAALSEAVLTFEELFRGYIFTSLLEGEERLNWDNHAGSRDGFSELKVLATSIQKCRSLCEKEETCLQYRFDEDGGVCGLSESVRLGERLKVNEGVSSGWMLQRIVKWMKKRECKVVKWVRANP